MLSVKIKNYIHLHFIILIWGFTAVLGKLIVIDALPLVWFRILIASVIILFFIRFKKLSLKVSAKTLIVLIVTGVIIALHWVTFFQAIKISNVSIVLATMSTGAFFTALLEPIWYARKMLWYEVVFGIAVMFGLYIIFKVETAYIGGILSALVSALLASIFSLINGKLIKLHKSSVISLYELGSGVVFLSVYLLYKGSFTKEFFSLSQNDWIFIFILASICTAYAFVASVKVMKYISPYSVMLTTNLEPVYGIILAFIILGDSEKMNPLFYIGALIILATVIANGVLNLKWYNKNRI